MQYSRRIFLADETLPKDEIDDLFEKLEPVKPPQSLIQRILTSVSHLPHPALPASAVQPGEEDEIDVLDNLVVRNEMLPPS